MPLTKYLSIDKAELPLPESFVKWCETEVTGCHIIAKDSVMMHYAGESVDEFPFVKVEPGTYQLDVAVFRGDDNFNRVSRFRMYRCDSKPTRGVQVGEIEVDYACVSLLDFDPFTSKVAEDESAYEEYSDEFAYEIMVKMFTIEEYEGCKYFSVMAGYGDGVYPAYALMDDSKVVGMECDFMCEEEVDE